MPSYLPVLLLAGLAQSPADLPVADPEPPAFGGPLLERPFLSGDWFGHRPALWDCGVRFDVITTQFGQGVASGGLEQAFPYGGRNDYYLNLDGQKLGLWAGSSLALHGESRYGESANLLTGALLPVNLMLSVPVQEGSVTALTGVRFFQVVSDGLLVYAGKINTLDDFRQPLTNATGLDGFLNTGLVFNPVLTRTVPYSTFGAGAVVKVGDAAVITADVLDTNDSPTTSGFETFFDNGVTLFGQVVVLTRFLGLPGFQGLLGTYSNGKYEDLKPSVYYDPVEGLRLPPGQTSGSWCLGYTFAQAFWESEDGSGKQWGAFGRLGLADERTSPVRWYADLGLAGTSPLRGRELDQFGVGYFYLGVSEKLKRLAAASVPLRDEQGVEVYYSVAVTPWCRVTPDVQVVMPFQERADPALVLGVRGKVDF